MTYIKSPCIQQCCLNDDDMCVGCYRTVEEITLWSLSKTTREQKQTILANVDSRKQSLQRTE